MSDKSDAWEDDILQLIFQNLDTGAIPTALNLSVGAATVLYASLHTASPGEAGDQSTNELGGASYTVYARQGITRGSGGSNWPKQGNNGVDNGIALTFGQRTETTAAPVASHVGIGTASSGVGNLMYHGILDSSLTVNQNVNPEFAIGALVIQEN